MISKTRMTLLVFLVWLIFLDCNSPILLPTNPVSDDSVTVVPVITSSMQSSSSGSVTPTPLSNVLVTVSPDTIVKLTSEPTQQPQSTQVSPSQTIQPTLSPEEARKKLIDLLKKNGGCLFPCQWGLTPGLNREIAFQALIEGFGNYDIEKQLSIKSDLGDKYGGIIFNLWRDSIRTAISISYTQSEELINIINLIAMAYHEWNEVDNIGGNITEGADIFLELMENYLPSQVLATYGMPTQIYILPFPDYSTLDMASNFSLILEYTDNGFLIEYILPKRQSDIHFQACLVELRIIELTSWDPGRNLGIVDVAKYTSGPGLNELNVKSFQTLEQATSMSLDEFYQGFLDPETEECIETRQDLWRE